MIIVWAVERELVHLEKRFVACVTASRLFTSCDYLNHQGFERLAGRFGTIGIIGSETACSVKRPGKREKHQLCVPCYLQLFFCPASVVSVLKVYINHLYPGKLHMTLFGNKKHESMAHSCQIVASFLLNK